MVNGGFANLNHRTWILDQEVNATILGLSLVKKWKTNLPLTERPAGRLLASYGALGRFGEDSPNGSSVCFVDSFS